MEFNKMFPGSKRKTIYSPELAKMLGDVDAALLLSQLVFWQDKQWDKKGRWIRKTREEWESELAMGRSRQEKARRVLVKAGLIEVTCKGAIPPTMGFRLNEGAIQKMWSEFQHGVTPLFVTEKKAKRGETNRQNLALKKQNPAKHLAGFEQEEATTGSKSKLPVTTEDFVQLEPDDEAENRRTNGSTSTDHIAPLGRDHITREDSEEDAVRTRAAAPAAQLPIARRIEENARADAKDGGGWGWGNIEERSQVDRPLSKPAEWHGARVVCKPDPYPFGGDATDMDASDMDATSLSYEAAAFGRSTYTRDISGLAAASKQPVRRKSYDYPGEHEFVEDEYSEDD